MMQLKYLTGNRNSGILYSTFLWRVKNFYLLPYVRFIQKEAYVIFFLSVFSTFESECRLEKDGPHSVSEKSLLLYI